MMAYLGCSSDIAAVSLNFESLISAIRFYWQLTAAKKYDLSSHPLPACLP